LPAAAPPPPLPPFPTRRSSDLRASPASRGALMQRKERNLPTPALARPGARRAAKSISQLRPAAEEILRLVLSSLDDMKAEDTVADRKSTRLKSSHLGISYAVFC